MASPRSAWSWLGMSLLLGVGGVIGWLSPRWIAALDERARAPAVISQVRELTRLEGVSYHVERVVDLKDEQRMLFDRWRPMTPSCS
jgi:hypothetical protein